MLRLARLWPSIRPRIDKLKKSWKTTGTHEIEAAFLVERLPAMVKGLASAGSAVVFCTVGCSVLRTSTFGADVDRVAVER